ncbi:MAG: glycosyltransferase family 2 protein [Sporocytophaga sp.]|uniref:glycosyltransferase family 2 protein n=1 Tax=Sporocytophaga sp. TaxID=2231183 RepID=UPI001AFE3AFB|nr:glycosyltransferase family A protein [Sporocytophaga sp.]MBO9702942.1 glycosyltransferase family 2 protein [Sporocytophaga sp.]
MGLLKISICTVCMNRLHHIMQTLPANIENNKDYPEVEFVLLDYNSSDGLEEWVKDNMDIYLKSGVLKYYRTEEPAFFDRTHSRNLLFKLATGEIISNVDADNFTGIGYAAYLNEVFSNNNDIYVVADTKKRYYFLRNAFGRFACQKKDYLSIGGMDETMKSYGSETIDLYERLSNLGRKEYVIRNTNLLKAISHADEERIENEFFLKNIDRFYNKYLSYDSSELLFLFKDHSYEKCKIVSELVETHLPATLLEGSLEKGTWSEDGENVRLNNSKNYKKSDNGRLTESDNNDGAFYQIDDARFLQNVAKNYSFIVNNDKLIQNKKDKSLVVNGESFGKGRVTYNFETLVNIS